MPRRAKLARIRIMYQPLPNADKVGMRRANGEIIHLPCGLLEGDRLDLAIRPIRLADVTARLQFVRGQPALFKIKTSKFLKNSEVCANRRSTTAN